MSAGKARSGSESFSGTRGGYRLSWNLDAQHSVLEIKLPKLEGGTAVFLVDNFVLRLVEPRLALREIAEECERQIRTRLPGISRADLLKALCAWAVNKIAIADIERLELHVPGSDVGSHEHRYLELSSCKTLRSLVRSVLRGGFLQAERDALRLAGLYPEEGPGVFELSFLAVSGGHTAHRISELNGSNMPRNGIRVSLHTGPFTLCRQDYDVASWIRGSIQNEPSIQEDMAVRLHEQLLRFDTLGPVDRFSERYGYALWFFVPLSRRCTFNGAVKMARWEEAESPAEMAERIQHLANNVDTSIYFGLPMAVNADFGLSKKGGGGRNFLGVEVWYLRPSESVNYEHAAILTLWDRSSRALWAEMARWLNRRLKERVYTPLAGDSPVAFPPEDEPPRMFRVNLSLQPKQGPSIVDEEPCDGENARRLIAETTRPWMVIVGYPAAIMPYYIDESTGSLRKLNTMRSIVFDSDVGIRVKTGGQSLADVRIEDGVLVSMAEVTNEKDDVVFSPDILEALKDAAERAAPRWSRILERMKQMTSTE